MKSRSRSARIAAQLADLKMPGALEALDEVLAGVDGGGTTAAEASGRRVYCGTLTELIDSLKEAQAAGRLNHRLKTLTHPALLVVDEIGYLPVTGSGAILFFQLVNRRY